jgi:hypothetical protein
MSDAAYTARPTNKAMAYERISKLVLDKDDAGQYQHDSAVKFNENVKRELAGMFNLLDRAHGMSKLIESADNHINTIKSIDAFTASDVLKKSKQEADKKTKESRTNTVYLPEITTRSDAQDEADRLNQYYQAAIGVKEGTTEAWLEIVGKDVLDPVLRDTDGIRTKGIDDYRLSDLAAATISGANRPKAPDVLAQLTAVLNKPYDFRKKVAVNFESQQAAAAKVGSYGITIGVDMMVLTLFANMDMAEQQEWGREFRTAMQSIRKKYPYHHVHDDASLQDILKELAAADSVRVLREAPEPESANAVGEQLTLLQKMMQQAQEYEEEAMGVQSDSESSADTKKSKNNRKRSNSPDGNRRRGRSNSRNGNRERNKCPHCKPYRRYANNKYHDEKKCYYNKQWKGWRPGYVCEELEIKFKPKAKFTRAMGGVKDASDDEAE